MRQKEGREGGKKERKKGGGGRREAGSECMELPGVDGGLSLQRREEREKKKQQDLEDWVGS